MAENTPLLLLFRPEGILAVRLLEAGMRGIIYDESRGKKIRIVAPRA